MTNKNKNKTKAPKKRRIGTLATIVAGVVLGAGAGLTLKVIHQKSQEKSGYSQVDSTKPESVISSEYVDKVIRLGQNPDKRDVYVIFQSHDIDYLSAASEEQKKEARERAKIPQLCIYRILESMHKKGGLDVVAEESVPEDDFGDVENPSALRKELMKKGKNLESYRAQVEGDDSSLQEYLVGSGGGAETVGLFYEDLFSVGHTNSKVHAREGELTDKLHDKNTSSEEREILFSQIRELTRQRSMDAINNAIKNSDKLYSTGKVKNKNVATVIGALHLADYKDLIEKASNDGLDYNLVIIYPKGVLN